MTESPISEWRDHVLRVIGYLSSFEIGQSGAARVIDVPIDDVESLLDAMAHVCREFAAALARLEGVDRREIYQRLAAKYA